jgi:type II secretory pathway pseudopilin PulG
MSNVLIGIIGVILFIGLALAGALFLGPRFQESTNNSRASAAVQAVSQISSAANMYRVQEGKSIISNENIDTVLRANNYLKSVPTNPTSGGDATLISATGTQAAGAEAALVVMPLATNADAVCNATAKQSGQGETAPAVATAAALPTGPSGCFKTSAAVGVLASGTNYAFARL